MVLSAFTVTLTVGFGMGISQVSKSKPVPVPVMGTGTYHTVICMVSHENHSFMSTCGFLHNLFCIFTNQKNIVENQKPSWQGLVLVNYVRRGLKMCRYSAIEVC